MRKRVSIIAIALVLVLVLGLLSACGATKYNVNIGEMANGSISVDKSSAEAGEQVTLTVTPDAGYKLSYVKVDGEALAVSNGSAVFEMPEHDVNIEAAFEKLAYTVTLPESIEHGSISASAAGGNAGETITLTVEADYGYQLASLKANDEVIEAVDGVYSFVLPQANVVISASFELVDGAVTAEVPEGGVSLSAQAYAGKTATAKFFASYEESGVKLVAYVEDSVVYPTDGIAAYIGVNQAANGTIGANNKGIVASIEGIQLVVAQNGEYAEQEASVNASVAPWANANGVRGYVANIFVSYEELGGTKEQIEGNITLLLTLSNADKNIAPSIAIYGSGEINNADTYPLLNADGSFSDNYYKYGAGQLGQGGTSIETGRYWDLSKDYGKDSENYADRVAVLDGHDDADNNLVLYRAQGQNIYAKATIKLTGIANTSERWGKFGMMLFNGASQQGFFFYVDAYVGNSGDVVIDNVNGNALGYNSAPKGWGNWTGLSGTDGKFNLETKTIDLALTAYDGMVYMYCGDTLVGEATFEVGDDAVIGFKSFGYKLEVSNYFATDDVNNEEFIAHRKELVNQPVDVLFLGDSYMDFWNSFGFEYHTAAIENKANIGVGGTQINYWIDKVNYVKKLYTPSKFVFHIGVNDIDDGNTTAEVAFDRFKNMVSAYQEAFPEAEIYWVSLIHNKMFAHKCGDYDQMNALVKAYCDEHDGVNYIDVTSVGVDENGNTRVNMSYDGLHMNAEYGYPLWGKMILEAIGYGDKRVEGSTLGDIDGKYAYGSGWSFSEDGSVANNTVGGEQAIWLKDMDYANNFVFTVDLKSSSLIGTDAWSKVGLILRNDKYSIFGYFDTNAYSAEGLYCSLVYRRAGKNGSGIEVALDWDWNSQGYGSNASKGVINDYANVSIAKIGAQIYMIVEGQVVSSAPFFGIEDESFVVGVMGFNRNIEAKNASVVTGTADEILAHLGWDCSDADLDGVADDAIWTEEVLGNSHTFNDKWNAAYESKFDLAAVKGTDGVYFLATITHKQSLEAYAQGDGTGWWNWLGIEFRFGDDDGSQRAIYFEKGKAMGFGGIFVGDYVTVAPTEEDGYNKTTVEFYVPYAFFHGCSAEDAEIRVKLGGWVVENGYKDLSSEPTVSAHGLRYAHSISVAEGTEINVPSVARKGDNISFSIDLAEGLKIESVLLNESVIEAVDGVYSFVMPDSDVTITVNYDNRVSVDMSAVSGKINVSKSMPEPEDEIEFTPVAPWNINKLIVNNSELVANSEGKYIYKVGTENVVVSAEFIVVTDGITIDGVLDENYGEPQSFKVEGNRDVTLYAKKTSHGVVFYLIAHTNGNVSDGSDWCTNHNFEFYLNNGDQRYVNSRGWSNGVSAFVQSAVVLESGEHQGQYEHRYEVFVEGQFEGNVQINYAFKAPGEAARYEGLSNPLWDRSDWWCPIVGGADGAKVTLLGNASGSRPSNLFITESGLLCTQPVAENGTIDGDLSEFEGKASVNMKNDGEKADFTFTGYVAEDGYYLGFTILQKEVSSSVEAWYLNDNIEINVMGINVGFSIVDDILCTHGTVTQWAMVRTELSEGDYKYKTVVELFIYYKNPGEAAFFRMGSNGNGFGGWKAFAWDGADRFKVTADGLTFVQDGYEGHALAVDGVKLDGVLDENFWKDVPTYDNSKCASSYPEVYALVQARKGAAGVYLAVTMYHNRPATDQIQGGDGAQWWQYLNIEYRFINGSWDNSYQRAASVYGGSVCCASGYVTGENTDDSISYSYKTVFEIFAPYEWGVSEQFAINGDIPLWISCVAESGWKWLIEFNQDTNAPQTVTNEGFVRK